MPNPEPQRNRNPRSSQPAAIVSGASRRRDAWLLSVDDGLLLELGPLLGDRYRTRPIEGIDALAEAGTSPWLLIFDVSLRHDARAIAARIEQQYPMAPIIIVCADGHSSSWASSLHRGSVCAILERGSLATHAWQDALQIAEQRLDSAAAAATSTTLASLTSTRNPFPPKRRLMLLLPLLLAGGLGWYFFGRAGNDHTANVPASAVTAATPGAGNRTGGADAPNAASTNPANQVSGTTAPPAAPKRSALELLSDARVAFRDEKSLLPRADAPGESALELYAQVLAQDPQNEEARDGMRRLFSVARSRIQADLSAGRLDDASHLLATFKGVGVDASVTGRLESDIAAARPRWLIAQARAALAANQLDTATQLIAQIAAGGGDRAALADLRHTLETHTSDAQLADMATRVRAAITAGALLEPAADSARTRFAAMQQVNRTHPLTLGVQHELQLALLGRVQSALRGQQPESAQPWLTAASELGGSPELSAARKQVQAEVEAGNQRAAAAAAAATQAAATAATSAAAASAKPDFINAKPTRPLNAVFPPRALEKGLKGQVVVEFMLDRKGKASDPRVVEASLPGVFDDAAMLAVRTGRYDTSQLGASGLPQRARLLVTFR